MKSLYFLLLSLVLLIGCQCRGKELIIDDFQGEISKNTVDFGASDGSILNVTADKDITKCGSQSLKIEYDLKPSGYMWIARGYNLKIQGAEKGWGSWKLKPEEIRWPDYNGISLLMYGRNTGSTIAFDLKDAQNQLWRILIDDDFTGWKEISIPFNQFFSRSDWQPQDAQINDIVDFPLTSYQFEPKVPGKGIYNFACVKLVKVKEKKK